MRSGYLNNQHGHDAATLTHGGISAMTWRNNDAILNASPRTSISPQFGERSAPALLQLTNRPADGRDFGGAIPLGACEQGRHTSFDEIDVLLDGAVVLLQHGPALQADELQMRAEAIECIRVHTGQDPTLNGSQSRLDKVPPHDRIPVLTQYFGRICSTASMWRSVRWIAFADRKVIVFCKRNSGVEVQRRGSFLPKSLR